MKPAISIVIPVYNREKLVGRAIRACLQQTFSDFEVILVDDGSEDGSVAILEKFQKEDARIRLLKHERNRGLSPTRNTGAAAAKADWVLFADSDDELLPSALETILTRVREVSEDVGRIVFMYRVDDGSYSPQPPLVEEIWDYEGYIRWTSALRGRSDVAICVRRSTFQTVRFAEDRTFDCLYHHDFAKLFRTASFPDVVAIVHLDATNRCSRPVAGRLLQIAPDNARARADLLSRHGEAIRAVSRSRFLAENRLSALYHFLAGKRREGLHFVRPLLRERLSGDLLALCAVGMIHRKLLAALMVAKARLTRGGK